MNDTIEVALRLLDEGNIADAREVLAAALQTTPTEEAASPLAEPFDVAPEMNTADEPF